MIIVEFEDDITVDQAKLKVKDKVDLSKADTDWPTMDNGSKVEPNVFTINIAEEVPILNINLKGNYTAQQLKKYGEYLEDEIEKLPEITDVEIKGAREREVKVDVDVHKMNSVEIAFGDIESAIAYENLTISGGDILTDSSRRNIRVIG